MSDKPPTIALAAAPTVNVVSQFVRDLSFETPAPPRLPASGTPPRFEVAVNVSAKRQEDDLFAAEQKINVKAEVEGRVIFNLELVYGGLFRLRNVPPERLNQVLLIDCQQILFPYARQVVTSTITNGGFPPLMLQPVDFAALFRKNRAALGTLPGIDAPSGKPN